MKTFIKILKITGIALLGLFVIVLLGYGFISHDISKRADKTYHFIPDTLTVENNKELIAKGAHLVAIKGCNDCHATDLGGKVFLEESGLGKISAPNLTTGKGGIGSAYSTADWLMALRHGVNKKGKALWIMPSQETSALSQEDLKAIIAYCRQVKPVDRYTKSNSLGPVLKVMTYFDKIPLFPVEKIDHRRATPKNTDRLNQLEMGKYLSVSCVGCHRNNFRGGDSPIPGMPHIPNITSTGNLGKWSEAQFMQTLKTGKTPSGHVMKNEDMPWKMTAQYTDEELKSLYTFLRSQK
jgi:cytochrome c553